MSTDFKKLIFLKVSIIAIMTSHIAFSGKEALELPDETSQNQSSLATAAPFDSLPAEMLEIILQKLPQKDLKNTRFVNKKFKEIATRYIQGIDISGQFSGEAFQLFQTFVKNLRNVNVVCTQNPSGAVLELFRGVPVKALWLENISTQDIQGLAEHLPLSLQKLDLYNNSIGAAGVKVLATHLAKFQNLRQLDLRYNDIGEAGVKVLMAHLPSTLREICLDGKNIKNEALGAFLEAVPKTDLSNLFISIPVESPLRDPFKNLRNRHNVLVSVEFL